MPVKIAASVLVIVLNYVWSKAWSIFEEIDNRIKELNKVLSYATLKLTRRY